MSTKIGGMVIKKGLVGGGKGSTRSDAFTRGGTWAEGGWYEEDDGGREGGGGGVEKGKEEGSSQRYGLWDFNLIKQFVTEYGTRQ